MRYLASLAVLGLGVLNLTACTESADVASKNGELNVGGATQADTSTTVSTAGQSNLAQGGSNAGTGGETTQAQGGASTNPATGGQTAQSLGGASTNPATGGQTAQSLGGASANPATGGQTAQSLGGASTNPATGGQSSQAQGGTSTLPSTTAAGGVFQFVRSEMAAISDPDIANTEYAAFIDDANDFGLGLYQQVADDLALTTKNGVFSPTSAQLALAMTYAGAAGDTATAMKTVLHDTLGAAKYHAGCNRLARDLASRAYTRTDSNNYTYRIELTPTNSLWAERTVPVNASFLDVMSTQYDTGIWQVDFIGQPDPARLAINAWVAERTHDRIKDLLLPPDIDSSTRFVLVNALYFYGTWQTPFLKNLTQSSTFHTLAGTDVAVDVMHATTSLPYKAASTYEVLQLAYVQRGLWMTLVLPSSGKFEEVRSQVSASWLNAATSSLATTGIKLSLPKFKIESAQMPLGDSLSSLGMAIAFSGNADFSGMTTRKPLYITSVLQKAFIGVDEDGTEAAAATAVLMSEGMPAPDPIPVVFDRPFLFFIQDQTGLVLFTGQVVDPTQ